MALTPPVPGLTATDSGLRSIYYDATSAAKLSLIVQPGDRLEVSDDVAAQLLATSAQFKEPTEAPEVTANEVNLVEVGPVVDEQDEPDEPAAEQPKPRKRTTKRTTKSDD